MENDGRFEDADEETVSIIATEVLRDKTFQLQKPQGNGAESNLASGIVLGDAGFGGGSDVLEVKEVIENDEGFEEDEQYDSDDEELLEALDWVDLMEDMESRGAGHGLGNSFGSGFSVQRRPNAFGGVHAQMLARGEGPSGSLQPRTNKQQKLCSKFRAGPLEHAVGGMSNSVATAYRENMQRGEQGNVRMKDKSDRATVEQVLDPRTRMVLFKMLHKGVFCEINGCISTGKEANVYHATTSQGSELAIKVYKTSILVFKDRDRYVQGDFRFRHAYGKHNPRKMVKTWAEKEVRNLLRLNTAGIRAPTPVLLRLHVLVMTFIGLQGWAAPRLKDANLSDSQLRACYLELVVIMRKMFRTCCLVHGDLSEYNILYYDGHLYIIDVSQSVDLDHPRALEFLRADCLHVTDFFKKNRVATMYVRELFDFITDPLLRDEDVDDYLEQMQERIANRPSEREAEDEVAEAVFAQAFIPRTLNQVEDYEKDASRIAKGENTEGIYYQTITGLKDDLSGVRELPALLEDMSTACRSSDPGDSPPSVSLGTSETKTKPNETQEVGEDQELTTTSIKPQGDKRVKFQEDKEVVGIPLYEESGAKFGEVGLPDVVPSGTMGGSQVKIELVRGGSLSGVDAMGVVEKERLGEELRDAGAGVEGSESEEESGSEGDSSSEGEGRVREGVLGKDVARLARKEHKKQVKEEKREARKTKIPKAVKKRRKKVSKGKK
eukprot:TRINITY_DN1867_c0_g1_i1.p1 TRINITY_DN1867_c0_g1~~TRINITY_DN1867_c0_g1_i1.p1  ORF type:complete len:721 (-),score=201.39 TRINITY_DN1867_c0_g1_i1:39-2201(-)